MGRYYYARFNFAYAAHAKCVCDMCLYANVLNSTLRMDGFQWAHILHQLARYSFDICIVASLEYASCSARYSVDGHAMCQRNNVMLARAALEPQPKGYIYRTNVKSNEICIYTYSLCVFSLFGIIRTAQTCVWAEAMPNASIAR